MFCEDLSYDFTISKEIWLFQAEMREKNISLINDMEGFLWKSVHISSRAPTLFVRTSSLLQEDMSECLSLVIGEW